MPQVIEPKVDTTRLIGIFTSALENAKPSLESAEDESLYPITLSCYTAFMNARDSLVTHGILPIVPGNDPHNLSAGDNTELATAIASVYGFLSVERNYKNTPSSIETLKRLEPIAREIHIGGYSIFT